MRSSLLVPGRRIQAPATAQDPLVRQQVGVQNQGCGSGLVLPGSYLRVKPDADSTLEKNQSGFDLREKPDPNIKIKPNTDLTCEIKPDSYPTLDLREKPATGQDPLVRQQVEVQ